MSCTYFILGIPDRRTACFTSAFRTWVFFNCSAMISPWATNTCGRPTRAVLIPRRSRTMPNRASMAMSVNNPMMPATRVGGWPITTRPATAPNMTMTTASNVVIFANTRTPNTRTNSKNPR